MKILFVSLGCDKNLVDSETMLGALTARGFEITNDETEAEVIVVNTCSFIHDAREESVQTLLEMADYREKGSCRALIVTGCLAQRYQREILEELPQVDAVLGTNSWEKIVQAVETALKGERSLIMEPLEGLPACGTERVVTTGGHYAHLKIAEGCDKHCTYCVIPRLRGGYRSYPMEDLICQAEELAARGVRELILVAQETTVYGRDLYGEKSLHLLLRKLCRIQGIRWIRILYCYPEEIYDELIRTIKEEPKICHYLDIPIQHCNNRILRRMGRRTTREDLEEIIGRLRREIPDICLRTTLITGFPGETQEEHEELLEFVNAMEFDRLGVFTYSREDDTPAARMEDQIPEEVKEQRRDELMELQQEISLDIAETMVGRELVVMVEGRAADEAVCVTRTYRDAPDIDGYLFLNTEETLMSGDFARVKVTGAFEYDMTGELIL